VADSQTTPSPPPAASLPYARWLAQALGLVLFHLIGMGAGREEGLWLPGLGFGIALVSWFGWWFAPLLAVDLFVVRMVIYPTHPLWLVAFGSVLLAAQIAGSWWCYSVAAQGSRWLDDPRAATVFLLIVPGGINAGAACMEALVWTLAGVEPGVSMWPLAGLLGISRALGILILAPSLLVLVTPLLTYLGLLALPAADQRSRQLIWTESTWGELIELAGLTIGNALLTLVLVYLRIERDDMRWTLWGISLLFVVWTSLRQGLQGGLFTATLGAIVALLTATLLGAGPANFNPMQGNLLGQTSTALLVGASASWIRASETRYRRVVGQIPVILYSVRLPRSLPVRSAGGKMPDSKPDMTTGPQIIQVAELTLVSQASKRVFGLEPAALEGPFTRWLEHVHADDRELVIAAVTQLVLQKQLVTCEYRVAATSAAGAPDANGPTRSVVWVRDTMAPHHGAEGRLDCWDGVIEDITEARALSQNVRRTSGMLQALVANLPTGVFFVQGPWGQPILVNARARQLLGQREDLSAGAAHISEIYRLHRPDGTPYPAEELPIVKALRSGTTCLANDIVVHRPDGRRVPLITWAAPVDLGNLGRPEAAVWVLEDMTTLQQAELARSESEARLRATFEALGEGLLIQDRHGTILECNPAAADILGVTPKELVGQSWLGLNHDCVQADGTRLPPDQQPDRVALTSGQAVRNCILGLPKNGHLRWLQVNSVPLPLGTVLGGGERGVRLVTTFADITGHRQTQEDLQKSQRLELMGRLASGTVHDFNNMLTALLGMASIARGGLAPEDPVRDDLNRIIDIGEQAANVAGQLLTFSKQRRAEARPIDVNVAVVHALTILRGIIPEVIHVETQLASGDLWVLADDTQLQQIVMNLCLNARDAMPTGGALTVSTTRAVEGGQAWIGCAIQDTGCGMDPVTVARIFEPFFTTKERGTGLGLAVVQQIIQQFGGRIEVKSETGKGTRFEFWLRECTLPQDWTV
jgi:PAS domain S-box-containing protein